jgi:hypothetical protein
MGHTHGVSLILRSNSCRAAFNFSGFAPAVVRFKTQTPLEIGPDLYGVCLEENAISIIASKIRNT